MRIHSNTVTSATVTFWFIQGDQKVSVYLMIVL